MRLIDADAVDFTIPENPDFMIVLLMQVLKNVIDQAPTIDPESIRPQAEWVDVYGKKYANHRYACSRCREDALYKIEADALGRERYVQALSDSCPNCGAKMRIRR